MQCVTTLGVGDLAYQAMRILLKLSIVQYAYNLINGKRIMGNT